MKSDSESFEKIFDALNSLYLKADSVLFEIETLATEIREKLDKVDAAALADEALADDRKSKAEEKIDKNIPGVNALGEMELF